MVLFWRRCVTFRRRLLSFRVFSSNKKVNMDDASHIIDAYKNLACKPSPVTALLRLSYDKDVVNIFSLWSIPDLVRSESSSFTKEFLLQYKSKEIKLLSSGIPCDVSYVSQWAFSKSGQRHAVIRKTQKSEESIFLEIWNLSQKERTFDMSNRKEHGKIHESGNFQSFEWSANEKYLLYIAEAKQKESESFFKDIFCQKADEKPSEDDKPKGEEYVYRESWGETFACVHHTVLCILEIETGRVEVVNLDDHYQNMSAAQATWGPNDEHIVFVGYKEEPFRLGLMYCINRSSSIFSYNLETKNVECLTPEGNVCVEHPVFSPNFENFVFLQNEAGGPHFSCRKLMKYDWKKEEISIVIDIVQDAIGDEFAGAYIVKLFSRWWSNDSRLFFFHTYRRSFLEIFCADIFSGKVKKIPLDKSYGACVLHDVQDPYILASVSSPNMLPHLIIGHFSHTEDGINVIWNSVDESMNNELTDLSWSVHTLSPSLPNKSYPNLDYEIIVMSSKEKKNGSLIVTPHGGPHSIFAVEFFITRSVLARLGYTVCLVNYRGSLGFGENSIKSLLGNVGTQDVSDVVDAVEFLKKDKTFGILAVLGTGGSHGGFLIAHLLGQYPDLLKAAVLRNPVIDVSNMVGTTDILDWNWIEAGCCEKYVYSETINPDILKEMWEKSPIKYGKKVKSPTLLCLGKNDLRVPSSQGFQFYKLLRSQNVPTKVFYYDDGHGLSKPGNTSDCFVQEALWLQNHLF